MAIYIYKCPVCGEEEKVIQSIKDGSRPLHCGQPMERVPQAPSLHFKGEGWTPRSGGGRSE